jgi:GT2 family glycosyltransferase
VIIVNNDACLKKDFSSEMRIVENSRNVGFGAACNAGAKIANGDILWFLNPDTEVISENISKIIREFKQNDKTGIIGPRLVDEKSNIQEWIAGKKVSLASIILNNLRYKKDKKIWQSAVPVTCTWVTGGAMFVRSKLFEKLGGFDEKFFLYFEDVDLCKRAGEKGNKVVYFPEFAVRHLGGGSSLDKKKQKKEYYAAQDYYLQKHFSKTQAGLIKYLRTIFSRNV